MVIDSSPLAEVYQKEQAEIYEASLKALKERIDGKEDISAEEKQQVAQYGSSDSGASLGDILGAALKEAQESKTKKK